MGGSSGAFSTDIELSDQEKDDLQAAMVSAFRCDADAWPLLRRIGYPAARFPSFGGHHRDAWQQIFADLDQGIVHAPYVQLLTSALRERPANAVFQRLAGKHRVQAGATASELPPALWSSSSTTSAAKEPAATEATAARHGAFLCHSSSDKDQVRALHRQLILDGIECWFDESDLLGGHDFDYEIRRALRRCRHVLVCLSSASVTKAGYLQKELRLAVDQADEQPEGEIYLIPVRLENCTVPESLRRLTRVDLFAADGYRLLLRSLRQG